MKKVSDTLKKEWIFYLIILFSAICFFAPHLGNGLLKGGELDFHYARIMTLSDSIKSGVFPAKIRFTHMKDYGYGIGFFYPDLFIYIPALLISLGAEFDVVIKIYLFAFILIGGFVCYSCFKYLSGNKYIALFGEILVMESYINDENLFDGGGFPHLFAYFFLIPAVCGLFMLLNDKKKGYLIYAVCMTSILLSHDVIFLTYMLVMIMIVLAYANNIVKKPVIFGKFMLVNIICMILTTAYWLPAMEQLLNVRFKAFYNNAYTVSDHILTLDQLIFKEIGPAYMAIFLFTMIAFLFMALKYKKISKDSTSLFIVNILLMILMCSRTIWASSIGEKLNFFEYTRRFDFIFTATLAIFVVTVLRDALTTIKISSIFNGKYAKTALLVAMIVLTVVFRSARRPEFFVIGSGERMYLTESLLQERYVVSGAEWLPEETQPANCDSPTIAYADDHSSAEGFKHDNSKYYEAWIVMDKEYYDVPYVYYYGYKAYLVDENMQPVEELKVAEASDNNGIVRVYMPKGRDGVAHLMVMYRKTPVQKISYLITLMSALLIALWGTAIAIKKLRKPRITDQDIQEHINPAA
ncbi:hypothetical protein [Butyrivibrio sp. YAB3001]|uniref:hypothetical protein n=1 Tax=Butyrivibrio sp. YAB3001 TaxID=1520812 RepID=UPI0008F61976|nr:hypothetical protein [Butyrivibrio sp. YAB3001]SFB76189.1 hypothetical protein SAMN02910398_00669 [Butyrivibrio sp. YAB3001]